MGDAGYILVSAIAFGPPPRLTKWTSQFGPIGREVLAFGTVIFAILAAGTQVFTGQLTLITLSGGTLCSWEFGLIFACFIFLLSLPRILQQLTWLSVVATGCILVAGVVGMIGAGITSSPMSISVAKSASFDSAFLSVVRMTPLTVSSMNANMMADQSRLCVSVASTLRTERY